MSAIAGLDVDMSFVASTPTLVAATGEADFTAEEPNPVVSSGGKLQPFSGSLSLYHATIAGRSKNIRAHGFVAWHVVEGGMRVFYPETYTGKQLGPKSSFHKIKTQDLPPGGSGIYLAFFQDNIWRGANSLWWGLDVTHEVRVALPENSGLVIVDIRNRRYSDNCSANRDYYDQWCAGWWKKAPKEREDQHIVDCFAHEHGIDVLLHSGRSGRGSFQEVIFKSARAYDYLNQLPRVMVPI